MIDGLQIPTGQASMEWLEAAIERAQRTLEWLLDDEALTFESPGCDPVEGDIAYLANAGTEIRCVGLALTAVCGQLRWELHAYSDGPHGHVWVAFAAAA